MKEKEMVIMYPKLSVKSYESSCIAKKANIYDLDPRTVLFRLLV